MNRQRAQPAKKIGSKIGVLGHIFELIQQQHHGQTTICDGVEQVFQIE